MRHGWRNHGSPARSSLLLLSQATRLSAEIERRIGFAQVVEERFAQLRVVRVPDLPPDDEGACAALLRFMQTEIDPQRLAGLYSVGCASAGVARAVNALGLKQAPGLVAHDFTDLHQALLTNGELAYVLHQDIRN